MLKFDIKPLVWLLLLMGAILFLWLKFDKTANEARITIPFDIS
jgi:hypothetical protein